MNDVDGLVLEELLIVLVDLRVGCAVLLRGLLGAFDDDVAERDHFDAGNLLQGRHVLAVRDAAAADNADADGVKSAHVDILRILRSVFGESRILLMV